MWVSEADQKGFNNESWVQNKEKKTEENRIKTTDQRDLRLENWSDWQAETDEEDEMQT